MLETLKSLLTSQETANGYTMTTSQAVAYLTVTKQHIFQLIKSGVLRAHKEYKSKRDRSGKWVILAQDVWDYDVVRKRHAETLRAWRHAWAMRVNRERQESAARRKQAADWRDRVN